MSCSWANDQSIFLEIVIEIVMHMLFMYLYIYRKKTNLEVLLKLESDEVLVYCFKSQGICILCMFRQEYILDVYWKHLLVIIYVNWTATMFHSYIILLLKIYFLYTHIMYIYPISSFSMHEIRQLHSIFQKDKDACCCIGCKQLIR